MQQLVSLIDQSWLTSDGYNFDVMERSILDGEVGFGNPHSKLSAHEQFLLWRQMIQQGRFENRDAFCNKMAECLSFQQGQAYVRSLCQKEPE